MRPTTRITLLFALTLGTTALVSTDAIGILRSANPPLNRASAPYNDYANCTECHSTFELNIGSGSVTLSGVPAEYTPGQTYTITTTVALSGGQRWGYETMVLDSAGDQIGTLSNPDANSQLRSNGGRDFASHQGGGTFQGQANSASWTFDWTAPAAGAGTAHFYASGNAANDSGSNSGDRIYNGAAASAEAGAAHTDGTVIAQPTYPASGINQWSRAVTNDRLKVKIRVTNHLATTENYAVVTRVKLPNGNFFPATGYITTDVLNLTSGETGTVTIDLPIKNSAPLGNYEFHALTGFAPATLVDTDIFTFEIIP